MEDINQLELAAYILIISNEITLYKDKTIFNYLDLLEDDIKNFFEETKYEKILDDMLSDYKKDEETMARIESMEEKRTYMFMGQAGHGKPIKR